MPIKRVQKISRSFRCSDGAEFGKKNEAVGHENFLEIRSWIMSALQLEDSFKAGVIARKMIDERSYLRALLSRNFLDEGATSIGSSTIEETLDSGHGQSRSNQRSEKLRRGRKASSHAPA